MSYQSKQLRTILFMLALTAIATPAAAASFTVSDTHVFGGTLGTFEEFSEFTPPEWDHELTFSPPAAIIDSATIELRHSGNRNNPSEVWLLTTQGAFLIGQLGDSQSSPRIDTFAVPISLYPLLPASGWTLALTLDRTGTAGSEQTISLDYSTFAVTYRDQLLEQDPPGSAVPEPASLLLLGAGLAGLAARRRRRPGINS